MRSIKTVLSIIALILSLSLTSSAQTGPGGVGNMDGTDGQAENSLWLETTSLSFTNGDLVTTWADISGNENDLTKPDTDFTPIFKNDIDNPNAYPKAEFSKDNKHILLSHEF
ncbi:MAG: hypothetical protein PF517_00740 [Salinivirgaceae bacterium]|jgi:hypothetical protein|nr:hypothetical protein [Salinivirgaceae bacterium]